MLSSDILLAKWNALPQCGGGFVRIDPIHPLEIYIGQEGIGRKTLLLVTNSEPSSVDSSKSIIADIGRRADGKWALALQLTREEQEQVFIQLCCDLIESSRNQTDDATGTEFFVGRYRQWLRLMEHQSKGLMDEATRKGLLGELLYIRQRIIDGMLPLDALDGWIGPDGADQDFFYADGWHEVKTEGLSSKTVCISSLEQLDAEPPGELIVCFIDKTASDNPDGFSLNDKVEELKSLLGGNARTHALFEAKLTKYGYMELREYGEPHYRLGGVQRYRIDASFPRLVKTNVPHEIVTTRYEICLSAIAGWKTD